MIVGQITDFHITTPDQDVDRRYRTAEHLKAAVAHVNALPVRPDVVVATGDLVHHGSVPEYERLRGLLEPLAMPVYLIPGNHDDRANLRAVFSDHPYLPRQGSFLHYLVEEYPLRLLALDTVVPGEMGGALCEARLAWIEARLSASTARPTFVFMHHPPFRTGVGWTDGEGASGLGGAAAVRRSRRPAPGDRAHRVRPPAPPDRGALGRDGGLHGAGDRASAGVGAGAGHGDRRDHGAAGVPTSPVDARRGHRQPHQLHRRIRKAVTRRLSPGGSCGSPWATRPRPRRAFRS